MRLVQAIHVRARGNLRPRNSKKAHPLGRELAASSQPGPTLDFFHLAAGSEAMRVKMWHGSSSSTFREAFGVFSASRAPGASVNRPRRRSTGHARTDIDFVCAGIFCFWFEVLVSSLIHDS